MSKKHFETVARNIKTQVERVQAITAAHPSAASLTIENLHALAARLAHDFAVENPKFQSARFLAACGF